MMNEIEPNLWLGNVCAAEDLKTLRSVGITHILTLHTVKLPRHIRQLDSLTLKHVDIEDMAKADLLNVLEDCLEFVQTALDGGHKVLVHCFAGVSRSASIIIAWVMRTHQITYDEAFDRVRDKRAIIGPNVGFEQQLQLFEQMGWRIDAEHKLYKAFRLRMAGVDIQKFCTQPSDYEHLVQPDRVESAGAGADATAPTALNYTCRKCRRILATDAQLFQHIAQPPSAMPTNPSANVWDMQQGLLDDVLAVERAKKDGAAPVRICQESIFVEPVAWMQSVTAEREGKLSCPKCSTKVGSFSWTDGCECPCGMTVAPAFYLVPSKVELSRRLVLPGRR